MYMGTDVHNIHSDRMAAFRYLAQGWGYSKMRKAKAVKQVKKDRGIPTKKPTYGGFHIF